MIYWWRQANTIETSGGHRAQWSPSSPVTPQWTHNWTQKLLTLGALVTTHKTAVVLFQNWNVSCFWISSFDSNKYHFIDRKNQIWNTLSLVIPLLNTLGWTMTLTINTQNHPSRIRCFKRTIDEASIWSQLTWGHQTPPCCPRHWAPAPVQCIHCALCCGRSKNYGMFIVERK